MTATSGTGRGDSDRPVGMIGLGAMGEAIALAWKRAQIPTLAWNRGTARRTSAAERGLPCVESVAELVSSCAVVAVCISDYAAALELLSDKPIRETLRGRTLIQFSTGTPEEVRALQAFADDAGTAYLDSAILAYPGEIGASALVAVSGPRECWEQQQALFAALSDDVRYLGDGITAAAALDLAVLSFYGLSHLGLVHGALIADAEGLDVTELTQLLADSAPSDSQELLKLGHALRSDALDDPSASIGVYANVLERILGHARNASLDDEIPRFAHSLYRRGIDAGLADKEVVALVRMLQRARSG